MQVSKIIAQESFGSDKNNANMLLKVAFFVDGKNVTLNLERLSGAEVDAHNVGHFLSQFLPKYFVAGQQRIGETPMEM